jgi:hypothetical protein
MPSRSPSLYRSPLAKLFPPNIRRATHPQFSANRALTAAAKLSASAYLLCTLIPNNMATPSNRAMPRNSAWTALGRSIRSATTRLFRAGRLANQLVRAICLADGTATRKLTARKPTTRETTTRNPTHDLLNRYATDEQKLKPTGTHTLNTSL